LLLPASVNQNKIIKKVEPNTSPYRPDVEPGLAAAAILDPPGGVLDLVEALHPHLEVPTTSLHQISHGSRSPPPDRARRRRTCHKWRLLLLDPPRPIALATAARALASPAVI